MDNRLTLIDELESAISHGSSERRLNTLRRVTDLFVFGSGNFSSDHVAVFDEVFARLISDIELSARAALASRLAPIANAPPGAIRVLAFDDAIEVAGPVLTESEALDNVTLVENANTKSQEHLLAISKRQVLAEVVTDVLVERGNREVTLSVTRNTGARFSEAGFVRLVGRSDGDDELARLVGCRPDIPRQQFLRLLSRASDIVRIKLQSIDRHGADNIRHAVATAAHNIQTSVASGSRDYLAARTLVDSLKQSNQLDGDRVEAFARAGQFEQTTFALAALCGLSVDAIERAMTQERSDTILIVAKAIGLSEVAVKAILQLRTGGQGLSTQALERHLAAFRRLRRETARHAVEFQRNRQGEHQPSPV